MLDRPDDNPPRPFPRPPDGLSDAEHNRQPSEYNIPAIISVSCGILGLVMFQILFAPVAIIFGAFGVHAGTSTAADTRRLAVAGYVLGIVDGIIWLVLASVFHVSFFPL